MHRLLSERNQLFGTDGIRGVANADLTPELVLDIGRAAGKVFQAKRVVVGRDTRRSGSLLSNCLHAGLQSVGIQTLDIGVMPVGGISRLVTALEADLGIMVSASHNPAPDNGIKFLNRHGAKLTETEESQLETQLRHPQTTGKVPIGPAVGDLKIITDPDEFYLPFLISTVGVDLSGMKLVLDTASGAAYQIATKLFSQLGAETTTIDSPPNGHNINRDCGAAHPEFLQQNHQGKIGLAFDGDADRLIMVDEEGEIVDGDIILALLARHLTEQGRLATGQVVTTVMSNLGLAESFSQAGIEMVTTPVGDRQVLAKMKELGANLGGEQSGHILLTDRAQTGDGLLTALAVLEIVRSQNRQLSELRRESITIYPQVLQNVATRPGLDPDAITENSTIKKEIAACENELGKSGRVLIRPSGTEPLIRIMVEASTSDLAHHHAQLLSEAVEKVISSQHKQS